MTKNSKPLPDAGGSFIRAANGSLRLAEEPETAAAELVETTPDTPPVKGAKQPAKEA